MYRRSHWVRKMKANVPCGHKGMGQCHCDMSMGSLAMCPVSLADHLLITNILSKQGIMVEKKTM